MAGEMPFCLLLQPPFTQLSSPYPAVWYLAEYLEKLGYDYACHDDSIACMHSIFSGDGLRSVFARAEEQLAGMRHPNRETEEQVAHFLSNKDAYCDLIGPLMRFLRGDNPSFAYRLCLHEGLPAGYRTRPLLESNGISQDEALGIGTAMLNDIADFISYAADSHFALIRYGSRIENSIREFSIVERQLEESWILPRFYKPILEEHASNLPPDGPVVACISLPFPGTLIPALYAAKELRNMLGNRLRVVLGGGYVSTELREVRDTGIFAYADYLAFDAGFGALHSILERERGTSDGTLFHAASAASPVLQDKAGAGNYDKIEAEALRVIHPTYTKLPFSDYIRIADTANPMHRIWNDTLWLKYRLAYGCYWHRCSFCDTTLDYVSRYIPSDMEKLGAAVEAAYGHTGVSGIHFTDEAMPPALARKFAAWNGKRGSSYTFWGNIRFDRGWTGELCGFCAERGLIAVSGGIEIATSQGLGMTNKGFDLEELVGTLRNLREAGILVHAYLMYGFPGQTDQSIADSAEVVRGLFAEGLVNSAFWHRFVLTRHSCLYSQYMRGEASWLKPRVPVSSFADNDLDFAGSEHADPWDQILETSLSAWSDYGETEAELGSFGYKLPAHPRIRGREYIAKLLENKR